jgi:uncharacterized protein YbjT (DUF2867 family)
MRITVFDASGRTGRLLVGQALVAGDQVVAYVRDPSKLDQKHARLTIIQGELTD